MAFSESTTGYGLSGKTETTRPEYCLPTSGCTCVRVCVQVNTGEGVHMHARMHIHEFWALPSLPYPHTLLSCGGFSYADSKRRRPGGLTPRTSGGRRGKLRDAHWHLTFGPIVDLDHHRASDPPAILVFLVQQLCAGQSRRALTY